MGNEHITIRYAQPADAEAIRMIYNHEVANSTATLDLVERSLADQIRWLEERTGAQVVVVAEDSATKAVAGFAALSQYKQRAAYATTVEDSIYLHPDFRGLGVGRALLERIVIEARSLGYHTVVARIGGGEENRASMAVHSSVGFRLVGIERQVGRKFGRWVDVAVMQRILDGDEHLTGAFASERPTTRR